MSQYFSGVTFAQQRLMASDDANVRRAIFNDCILRGCEISASGFTLTLPAGYLMICGRQIRNQAPQSWPLTESGGVARLTVDIQVSWIDGKEAAYQIQPLIEYAQTQQLLPELLQEDINNGGSRYQQMLCVATLTGAGISGFDDKLITLEVT